MLPESLICFKVIDIFSVLSEKTHEILCYNVHVIANLLKFDSKKFK